MRYAYGNNSQTSYESFEHRRYYDTVIVPISKEEVDIHAANDTFIDIFINKPYYGRIDHHSDAVIAVADRPPGKSAPLVNIPFDEGKYLKKFKTKNNIYAMNFVVDAFEDMALYFNRACQLGSSLLKEGPLGILSPEVGWVSARQVYENYIKDIYNYFVRYYDENRYDFEIKDFSDFYVEFKRFLIRNRDSFSILYSSFCMSRYVSPNISGLIVEIAIDDHSDDFIKTSKYLSNKNYEFFKESAKRYGFYVDRNVPWRLIANLSSGNMVPYMKKYGLENLEDVFNKQFTKSYKYDLTLLRETIARIYNLFVANYPNYKKIVLNDCVEEPRVFKRAPLNLEQFYNNNPLERWLNLYLTLRAVSTREEFSTQRLHQFEQQVKQIFLSSGLDAALLYVNNIFNGYRSTVMKKEFFTAKWFDAITTDTPEKKKDSFIEGM